MEQVVMLLKDKVCVVAGAASLRSIGYATAELFAEHGAKVVVVDVMMDDKVLGEVKSSIEAQVKGPVSVHGVRCDISKAEDCDELVRQVLVLHDTIDCLVNSAGIVRSRPILEINEEELDLMFDINLKGAFFLCQSVLKVFAKNRSGTIVNVASLAAQRGGGLVGGAHYAASKGGMLSLTKSIAREFGALGIRANAICPAMIETPMLDGLSAERLRGIIDAIPLKRTGTTREMAGACLFLASDLSGFVTGATIDVNGGAHIH
jgi:NAD(P)-dependent dehydrogenase (short-subunit alcohol dehydrogenase family)